MFAAAAIRNGWLGLAALCLTLVDVSAECGNSVTVPRLVSGDFQGIVYTPNLSFKNLSSKQCEGSFEFFQGDFGSPSGQFEFNGEAVEGGRFTVSLAAGQGLFGQLRKLDQGGFEGFGYWELSQDCQAGTDVALTADVQVGTVRGDGRYEVLDQIGFSTAAEPARSWGFAARKALLPDDGGSDSTAFAIAPCQPGPYRWTVDYFGQSGLGQLSSHGTASGPTALFIEEVFEGELPAAFNGYAVISVDKPSHLEALTVAWGPGVQGGVQLSNFPVRPHAELPYAQHALAQELQQALDEAREAGGIIGVSAAIQMPGQPLWTGASGISAESVPLSSDMYFGLGSATKNYVAALVLLLAEEGVLELDDPLSRWLPHHNNIDPSATIRQLLNHTSGIYNFTNHPDLWTTVLQDPTRFWTPEEVLDFVGLPQFPPGTSWGYSNTNYTLLGMIVREATGSEVSVQLHQRIFDPLNLSHTFLEPEEATPGNMAHPWDDTFTSPGVYQDISGLPRTSTHSVVWTAGSMFSTASDAAKWLHALFEGRVISSASLNQMLTFQPANPGLGINGYGLGVLHVELSGRTFWGHGGDIFGYTTMLLYSPEKRTTLALLINQNPVDAGPGTSLIDALMNVVESSATSTSGRHVQ